MGQQKLNNLDHILFENVSYQVEGLDPVLVRVDLDFPMDQTVIIQSSNPTHSVHILEMLSGRKAPNSGKIKWTDADSFENREVSVPIYELVSCYFESNRPDPNINVLKLLTDTGVRKPMLNEAIEHFERAIAIDGGLGNAWLGRGLCRIRQGKALEGRQDIQVAATVEPTRAIFRDVA